MDWKNELHDMNRLPDQKTIEKTLKKMLKIGILIKVGKNEDGSLVYQPNKEFVNDVDKITNKNWKDVWNKWKLEKAFKIDVESDYKRLKKKYKKVRKDDLKKHMLYDLMMHRKEQKKDLSYIG